MSTRSFLGLGSLFGQNPFLWSVALNWGGSTIPVGGDSVVTSAIGTDDLSLSLNLLSLGNNLDITAALQASALSINSGVVLRADAGSRVSLGAISGAGGTLDAAAGAVITVGGATDPGETYQVEAGGMIVLDAVPSAASTFVEPFFRHQIGFPQNAFAGQSPVIAFANPGTPDPTTGIVTIASSFSFTSTGNSSMAPSYGDVIEVPGVVSSVQQTFDGSAPATQFVTSAGIYDFTGFAFGASAGTYVTSFDQATGLGRVTFGHDTVLSPGFDGTLWSNPAVWSPGVPFDGVTVTTQSVSTDDIANLVLPSLTIDAGLTIAAPATITTLTSNGGLLTLTSNVGIFNLISDALITVGAVKPDGTVVPGIANGGNAVEASGGFIVEGHGSQLTLHSLPAGVVQVQKGGEAILDAVLPALTPFGRFGAGGGTIALLEPGYVGTPGTAIEFILTSNAVVGDVDTVELPGTPISVSQSQGTEVITSAGTFDILLGVNASSVSIRSDAALGLTAVDFTVGCFADGTRIATDRGAVAVEDVVVGDLCVTAAGALRPVTWVGSRRVDASRHPRPEAVLPVRIAAGAFGPFTPARDLWLSPDHALSFQGSLIPARCLVDGAAVTADADRQRLTYHHIQLDAHDVVLAEGLAVESFLDTGDKDQFAGAARLALHPDFSARAWEAEGCAPLAVAGPTVDAARARLARWTKPETREPVPRIAA